MTLARSSSHHKLQNSVITPPQNQGNRSSRSARYQEVNRDLSHLKLTTKNRATDMADTGMVDNAEAPLIEQTLDNSKNRRAPDAIASL